MLRKVLRFARYVKNYGAYRMLERNLQAIEEFDREPGDVKRRIQVERIGALIAEARENTDYYRAIIPASVDPAGLATLPVLTKRIIRAEGARLVSRCPLPMIRNTSGGTTGEPVSFMQCDDFRRWVSAYNEFHFRKPTGKTEGERRWLKLWGSEREILEGSLGFRNRLMGYLNNIKLLNSFRMTDADLVAFVDAINRFRPDVMEAYAQSAFELARTVLARGAAMFSPTLIMVSAGTLYDFMEEAIRAAFPVSIVQNRYGSREAGNIAYSCNGRDHLHVCMLTHYLEVVDDAGVPVADGTQGDILVTLLSNRAMPLVRYAIGDRGVLRRNAVCPHCGWQGDILERIVGRTVDIFRAADGARVDGEYFTHLFYFRPWLRKFQVIQQAVDRMDINLVLGDGSVAPSETERIDIEAAIHRVLPGIAIAWNIVPDIVYDVSGKIRFTISKVQ